MYKCVIFDFLGVLHPDVGNRAQKVVKEIKDLGIHVAGITNLSKATADKVAENCGIQDYYVATELNLPKTNGVIYEKFLTEFKFNPNECLIVDDLPENLVAPKAIGMSTVYLGKKTGVEVDHKIEKITDLLDVVKSG